MFDLERVIDVHPAYGDLKGLLKLRIRQSHILFVLDGPISIGAANDFGLSKVIALLRSTSFGLAGFTVTLASRDGTTATVANPAPEEFKYRGFRFDQIEANGSRTIDQYHQIWCFGFWPGNGNIPGHPNNPNSLDPSVESALTLAANVPLSDGELEQLTRWMNERGGGVFATGDHHILGSPMCARIPRVSTMRRWRVADGAPVPTVGLPTRHDTNRPATSAQQAGTAQIPNSVERDSVPQPIEWVPDSTIRNGIFVHRRPHPILCHPTHGPIDVFPDHPHEGHCFDPASADWQSTRLDASYDFNGYSGLHYPSVAGQRPQPQVIAFGRTLADPPLDFAKGDQTARRFPLVVAYDGQRVGIGRVVVDSTWHHWFDMNLAGLEGASNQVPIEKIRRYFINVAVWLASSTWRTWAFLLDLALVNYRAYGAQELVLTDSLYEIGRGYRGHLNRFWGPCWTTEVIWGFIQDFDIKTYDRLRDLLKPRPWPCLSCPPIEALEFAVLGALVRDTATIRIDELSKLADEPAALKKRLGQSVRGGLAQFSRDLLAGRKQDLELFETLTDGKG
jgi:hypothetical protein